MSNPDMGSIFPIKKSMKYSGHRKLLCESSKLSSVMLSTSSVTKRTLMHLFLFKKFRPERTGLNMYAEYTQLQLTSLANNRAFSLFHSEILLFNCTCTEMFRTSSTLYKCSSGVCNSDLNAFVS